jgi:protein-S-isoprenylcysteine O-methyltransferase Ste14
MTAPRAMIGVVIQGLGLALVSGVRDGRPAPIWRGPAWADALAVVAISALVVGSCVLIAAATRHLGRHWAIQARTLEHHELITTGPYRFVRHPIYTAVGGLLVAMGLAFAPAWALALACVAYGVGTIIRTRAEDALMAATFGSVFEEYRRRVPALIPRPPGSTQA